MKKYFNKKVFPSRETKNRYKNPLSNFKQKTSYFFLFKEKELFPVEKSPFLLNCINKLSFFLTKD